MKKTLARTEVRAYKSSALDCRVGAYFSARHECIVDWNSVGPGYLSNTVFRPIFLRVSSALKPWVGGLYP